MSSRRAGKTAPRALGFDKCQEVRVDLVFVGRAHAVRCTLMYLQLGALDDFGGLKRSGSDRDNRHRADMLGAPILIVEQRLPV
jgi:hypothetical protein